MRLLIRAYGDKVLVQAYDQGVFLITPDHAKALARNFTLAAAEARENSPRLERVSSSDERDAHYAS